ncbi:MAG: hypothetical protein ACUVV6_05935 [Thermoplasmatota archaeon]
MGAGRPGGRPGRRLPDVVFIVAFASSLSILLSVSVLSSGELSPYSAGAIAAVSLLIAVMGRLSFVRRRAMAASRALLERTLEERRRERGA